MAHPALQALVSLRNGHGKTCLQSSQPREVVWIRCESVIHADTWGLKIMVGLGRERREHWMREAGTLALCHSEGATPGVWGCGFQDSQRVALKFPFPQNSEGVWPMMA